MNKKFASLGTVLSREESKKVLGGVDTVGGEGLSCFGLYGQAFCRANSFCLDCRSDGFGLATCQRNDNCISG